MGRRKLPEDPRRKKQVSTFLKRYGRQGYQQAGSIGGRDSPTKFTSESASRASKIGWEKRRARQALEKENETNERQSTNQEE